MGKKLELAVSVLNGTIGDYLARTGNGLAIDMSLVDRHLGVPLPLPLDRDSVARAHPNATSRVALLVHGIMCTETIWELPDGSDYGTLLARDFGFTPLYVRYNTGRAIPDNGAALDALLESLIDAYPVPIDEILLIGFSMGGLVIRGACHSASLAGHRWLPRVQRAIYVGTPHEGAPLERVGRFVTKVLRAIDDPYTRLVAEIGDLRSMGIKDLGDGVVRHEDRDPRLRDPRHPVPLLPSIRHYLLAGSLSSDPRLAALFGDALVPVPSATAGRHPLPEAAAREAEAIPRSHVRVLGGVGHLPLARHPEVYAQIRAWCEEP